MQKIAPSVPFPVLKSEGEPGTYMNDVPYSQMRRLRSDKAELEDRIRDLEARLSEQAVCIREMERRQKMEKERADDAEMRLKETADTMTVADYPIVVPRDGITARWTFTSAPKVRPKDPTLSAFSNRISVTFLLFLGEALNEDIGLSLKDRNICFLLLSYNRTVLFG